MGAKKVPASQKEIKQTIKAVEDKAFGQKNKNKSGVIKKQLQKLELTSALERKRKRDQEAEKEKVVLVQPKAAVGVDPKTIPCVYFQNKLCTKGDKCKYGHTAAKTAKEGAAEEIRVKKVCQFLVDVIHQGTYNKEWRCPDTHCRDLHKLTEISQNGEVEVTLEEYLELSRQSLGENLTPMTQEIFLKWRAKKQKEEQVHKNKVKYLSENKGRSLFDVKPEIFEDDEEGEFIDYTDRCEVGDE